MKIIQTGVILALVTGGLAALPGLQAQAAPSAGDGRTVVQRMAAEATNGVRTKVERTTGEIGFVRATGGRSADLMPTRSADSPASAAAKATAYLDEYAAAFGAGADELTSAGVTATTYGWTVRYDQTYRGVPVFGARLLANLDRAGDLTSVNGFVAPDLDLSVSPRFSRGRAASHAVATVLASPPGDGSTDLSGVRATSTQLVVYRMGAVKGERGANVLAWAVEVSDGENVRDMVFVDASTGKVVNRYSLVNDALDREVYEAAGSDDPSTFELVWSEGDPYPGTLDESQQDLVLGTGESYWLYQNTFGYDSYDGEGATMTTVANDGRINCPNANWNGQTTNYCDGLTSDDTVSHEWGHAYTEHTSGLIYQWQPGAMNEAYSDIWGEVVDIINDRYNETPDTPRTEGQCSQFTRGEVQLTINSPAEIAGPCDTAAASFGPVFTKAGVTSDVVVATDAENDEGPSSTDGCTAFTNPAAVEGAFAYVDRGSCFLSAKADNAEAAGAIGIVIGNNAADAPTSPGGTANIYGVMIDQASGQKIKDATGTVNVTVKDVDEASKDRSYRWLSGEGDDGGAIRDMWSPTCYGDPGKVSDAEYHCSDDDSGGVHTNSGVVNHTFALLVDGSTSNGVEVAGIGLDKAAHLFWRAQTSYLGPMSDFADLADALTASCTDLTGQPLNALTVEEGAKTKQIDPITAADCASVLAATRATELTEEPVQCNFQPMLAKNPPALCGKGFRTRTVWKETFEKGLGAWRRTQVVVYEGGHGYPWKTTRRVPGDHGGTVAFDAAPDEGDCSAAAGDISSSNGIVSPAVQLPNKGAPKLSFDHYMATEPGFDGGNVQISVNGGKFKAVKASAYLYNPPTALASAAEGNTNPLAGQVAFTGTDGGVPSGSWGTSIIDLQKTGAKPGQKVRVKLELGRDGCGGNDGWYVDNVTVVSCRKKASHHRVVAGRD